MPQVLWSENIRAKRLWYCTPALDLRAQLVKEERQRERKRTEHNPPNEITHYWAHMCRALRCRRHRRLRRWALLSDTHSEHTHELMNVDINMRQRAHYINSLRAPLGGGGGVAALKESHHCYSIWEMLLRHYHVRTIRIWLRYGSELIVIDRQTAGRIWRNCLTSNDNIYSQLLSTPPPHLRKYVAIIRNYSWAQTT